MGECVDGIDVDVNDLWRALVGLERDLLGERKGNRHTSASRIPAFQAFSVDEADTDASTDADRINVRKCSRSLPSKRARGQDDVSSQTNSLRISWLHLQLIISLILGSVWRCDA